jgi:hypothetical protein
MEAHARAAYEAHIKSILIQKMNLKPEEFTPEQKKEFDEDVASLFTLKKVDDVSTIKPEQEKNKND